MWFWWDFHFPGRGPATSRTQAAGHFYGAAEARVTAEMKYGARYWRLRTVARNGSAQADPRGITISCTAAEVTEDLGPLLILRHPPDDIASCVRGGKNRKRSSSISSRVQLQPPVSRPGWLWGPRLLQNFADTEARIMALNIEQSEAASFAILQAPGIHQQVKPLPYLSECCT